MTSEKALNIIAGLCSKKEYCSRDISEKLIRWELPEQEIAKIMQYLHQHKFIDDNRFARIYAEDKFKFNHWGKQNIALMLKQKGISPETISEALKILDTQQYHASCLELLKQKSKMLPADDFYKTKAKLIRFALGRGFDYDTINTCLEQLL